MTRWCKSDQVEISDCWVIEHKLSTTNLWIKCYINISNELTRVIPKSIQVVDANTIEIKFNEKYNGQVLIQ